MLRSATSMSQQFSPDHLNEPINSVVFNEQSPISAQLSGNTSGNVILNCPKYNILAFGS